jgi:3-isopropylmalate dehydrogenase
LFASIRPIKPHKTLLDSSPLKIIEGADFIVFRELTGVHILVKKKKRMMLNLLANVSTQEEITELAIWLLNQQERKKKVTVVDKANVLETSRLWRKVVKRS